MDLEIPPTPVDIAGGKERWCFKMIAQSHTGTYQLFGVGSWDEHLALQGMRGIG